MNVFSLKNERRYTMKFHYTRLKRSCQRKFGVIISLFAHRSLSLFGRRVIAHRLSRIGFNQTPSRLFLPSTFLAAPSSAREGNLNTRLISRDPALLVPFFPHPSTPSPMSDFLCTLGPFSLCFTGIIVFFRSQLFANYFKRKRPFREGNSMERFMCRVYSVFEFSFSLFTTL